MEDCVEIGSVLSLHPVDMPQERYIVLHEPVVIYNSPLLLAAPHMFREGITREGVYRLDNTLISSMYMCAIG